VHANKAVANSSGFQVGALEVAQREDVVLFKISERYAPTRCPSAARSIDLARRNAEPL
jgi:hypothetical protein